MTVPRALRREQGFSLVELLVAMSLFIVILTATLFVFEGFTTSSRRSADRMDSVEKARRALEVQARQLRNLALRVNNQPVIDRLTADDFIFQTSDPTKTWVRYCLDSTNPANARLLQMESTANAVSAAMKASCPGSGWTRTNVVADNVVNRIQSQDRPVFQYACAAPSGAPPAGCPATAADYPRVISVDARLYVDTTPLKYAPEVQVASGVYLRNQNQSPTASFTVTNAGVRQTILNGSGSSDFEGRTLRYYWFSGTAALTVACNDPSLVENADGTKSMWGRTYLGSGVSLSYKWPAGVASPQTVTLVVCDPGHAYGQSAPTTVPFLTS